MKHPIFPVTDGGN